MHSGHSGKQTIAVFGLGYVGCVTSACLASLGHQVRGVDKDSFKVNEVNAGRAPFFEPGLPALVEAGVAAGRLNSSHRPANCREPPAWAIEVGKIVDLQGIIHENECAGGGCR